MLVVKIHFCPCCVLGSVTCQDVSQSYKVLLFLEKKQIFKSSQFYSYFWLLVIERMCMELVEILDLNVVSQNIFKIMKIPSHIQNIKIF